MDVVLTLYEPLQALVMSKSVNYNIEHIKNVSNNEKIIHKTQQTDTTIFYLLAY